MYMCYICDQTKALCICKRGRKTKYNDIHHSIVFNSKKPETVPLLIGKWWQLISRVAVCRSNLCKDTVMGMCLRIFVMSHAAPWTRTHISSVFLLVFSLLLGIWQRLWSSHPGPLSPPAWGVPLFSFPFLNLPSRYRSSSPPGYDSLFLTVCGRSQVFVVFTISYMRHNKKQCLISVRWWNEGEVRHGPPSGHVRLSRRCSEAASVVSTGLFREEWGAVTLACNRLYGFVFNRKLQGRTGTMWMDFGGCLVVARSYNLSTIDMDLHKGKERFFLFWSRVASTSISP